MKKGIKIILIFLFITLLLAGAVYAGLYYGGVIEDNSVSAEEVIDRTAEDIKGINLKIDKIEVAMQAIQENQTLSAEEVAEIKANMQEQINTLRTYQTLIKSLQDEVRALKEMQESTNNSIQADLQSFVTKLEYIESIVDSITSMTPSDEIVTDMETVPVAGQIYFEAPSNGVLYIRIAVESEGEIGMHLRAPNGVDLAYNTQKLDGNSDVYNATFVMRAGQKIYCYEFSAGYLWGGYSFVKSETN